MKTKEEILKDVANANTYETWIELLYDSKEPSFTLFVCEAMQLYSDQQNNRSCAEKGKPCELGKPFCFTPQECLKRKNVQLDQQNKELRQDLEQLMKSINKNFYVAEIQRLTKEVEELKRHNTEQASIKHDLRVEITELTKEVEEFRKSDREHIYYADKLEREITRLRELLGRAGSMMSTV